MPTEICGGQVHRVPVMRTHVRQVYGRHDQRLSRRGLLRNRFDESGDERVLPGVGVATEVAVE